MKVPTTVRSASEINGTVRKLKKNLDLVPRDGKDYIATKGALYALHYASGGMNKEDLDKALSIETSLEVKEKED